MGALLEQANQKDVVVSMSRLRAQLGEAACELEWAKGAHLCTEQAIALALS